MDHLDLIFSAVHLSSCVSVLTIKATKDSASVEVPTMQSLMTRDAVESHFLGHCWDDMIRSVEGEPLGKADVPQRLQQLLISLMGVSC